MYVAGNKGGKYFYYQNDLTLMIREMAILIMPNELSQEKQQQNIRAASGFESPSLTFTFYLTLTCDPT